MQIVSTLGIYFKSNLPVGKYRKGYSLKRFSWLFQISGFALKRPRILFFLKFPFLLYSLLATYQLI